MSTNESAKRFSCNTVQSPATVRASPRCMTASNDTDYTSVPAKDDRLLGQAEVDSGHHGSEPRSRMKFDIKEGSPRTIV